MKKFLNWPAIALMGVLSLGVYYAWSDSEVSASFHIQATADFEAPLTPIGGWVEVGSYGRCWHPNGVSADWRPYGDGQWELTDAGWYWQSDEPWAWACYHYGNWFNDPSAGWVWSPGVEWAPAWVEWRSSDAHIGWAPIPPHGLAVAPEMFAFVDIGHFHDRITPARLMVKDESIIRETKEISGGRRGPEVALIQKHVGNIKAVSVREIDQKTHYPATVAHKVTAPAKRIEPEKRVEPERREVARPEETRPVEHAEPAHEAPGAERRDK